MCEYPSVATPYVGIDIAETGRLADRLAATLASPTSCSTRESRRMRHAQVRPIEHLAAHFAAEEAVIKALGLDGFDPLDVEVMNGGEN